MTDADTRPDAYELLSKPTLDLTDEEVAVCVADLRRRRELFVKTGKVDQPKKEKVDAVKLSADEKRRNTETLMAQLVIPQMSMPEKK